MRILQALLAVGLLCAVPARAQQLDLAALKCSEFISKDQQTVALVLMWLDGYFADEGTKPVVDLDKMKENGKKLREYCGKNPEHSIITAAEEVMQ